MPTWALAQKLFRYGLTGGAAAIVDWGGFVLLYRIGLALAAAAATSFVVAALVNYALSSRYVFDSPRSARGFARFLAVAVAGLGVNLGLTLAGVRLVGLAPAIAKAAGIGCAFFVNFVLNQRLAFPATGVQATTATQRASPRRSVP